MQKYLFLVLILASNSALASYELEGILHEQIETDDESIQESNEDLEGINQDTLNSINAGSSSIDDILRHSNIATTARGPRSSGESPQIRGLDKNKVFVMVDGSRQNFQTGHNSMIAVDTENLKAAKIYKSSSSIANSGSLGGGVNFVTKDAKDFLKPGKSEGSEFKTRYSSVNQEKSINGKYIYKQKDNSGFISMSSASAEDLTLSNGETLNYSSFEDKSILIKNRYKKLGVKVEVFEREDDAPIDPTLNPPSSIKSLFSKNTTTRTNLSFDYKNKNFTTMAYYNGFRSEKIEEESNQRKTRLIDTIGLKAQNQENSWFYGGETYQDKLTSKLNGEEILSYPNASGTNYILFAEKTFALNKTKVIPGVRFNAYELSSDNDMPRKSDGAISRKLEINHQHTSEIKSYLSLSEGFNAPRVNEVYPSGLHSAGDDFVIRDNFFIPNEDLSAERSFNKEVGLKVEKSVLEGEALIELNISAYENKVKDYIYMERIDRSIADTKDGTTQFVNIPDVTLYGGELELKGMYDAYEASIGYTKVRGKNETANLYLEDLPADQYNINFNYYLDKYQLKLGYLGNYALEQHRVNPQTIQRTDKTDSYYIHNIYLNKKFKNINVDFRVDNFTNTKYRKHASHLYEAGEDYKLALTYKINTL